jgi:tetratricopeptide (TPR) repeat protein
MTFLPINNSFNHFILRKLNRRLAALLLVVFGSTQAMSAEIDVLSKIDELAKEGFFNPLVSEVLQSNINGVAKLISEKQYRRAITVSKQLEETPKQNITLCYLLSLAYFGQRDWQAAIDTTKDCLKLDDSWATIYTLQGTILTVQKKYPKAERKFDKAIALDPALPGPYIQRAKFYFSLPEFDEAVGTKTLKDIANYTSLGGDTRITAGFIGSVYMRLERFDKAEENFVKAISLQPDNLNMVKQLLDIYNQSNRFTQANTLLSNTQKNVNKVDSKNYSQLNLLQAKQAIFSENSHTIEHHFKVSLQAQPENINARKEFIYWLDTQERLPETIDLSQAGLKYVPDDPYFTSYMAWALTDQGTDLWNAERWLKKAKRLEPDNVYLLDTQSWLAVKRGKFKQALVDIQPCLEYADQSPEIAYHAGVIFHNLGKLSKAQHYLNISLSSGSAFNGRTQATYLLAKLHANNQ